jgi:DNA-binding MarR family transcriptional regulator
MRAIAGATDAIFQDALLALFQLHGQVLDAADVMSAGLGLTGARWQVLRVVAREPMTASQVARRLGLQRQSVQRTVDQLWEAGLVELRANRDHQRAPLVALLPTGTQALASLERRRAAWVTRCLRGFAAARLVELQATLAELAARVGTATEHERAAATPARTRASRRRAA